MGRKKKIEEPEVEPEVILDEVPEEEELEVEEPEVEETPNEEDEPEEEPEDEPAPEDAAGEVDDTLTGRIHKGQFSQTKRDIQTIIQSKIKQKIDDKKQEFIKRAREAH